MRRSDRESFPKFQMFFGSSVGLKLDKFKFMPSHFSLSHFIDDMMANIPCKQQSDI